MSFDVTTLPSLPCRLLVAPEVLAAATGEGEASNISAFKSRLEKGSQAERERALDALIATLALEGDASVRQEICAQLLVPVLRFVCVFAFFFLPRLILIFTGCRFAAGW